MGMVLLLVLLQSLWLRSVYCNVGLDGAGDLFKFVTRPDLMSPKWNITYHDKSQIAPGYWFVTPFKFLGHWLDDVKWTPCQMGPMIYDNDGELVWSGACQFNNRIMYDLEPIHFAGQTVLKAIVMHSEFPVSDCGAGLYLDSSYEVMHNFFIDKEDFHVNLHEFNYIEHRNTTLITTRKPRRWSGHSLGLMEDLVWIESNGIRAYDMTSGNVTFKWHAEDHVQLEESTFPPAYSIPPEFNKTRVPFTNFTYEYLWDPWHINSIDENPEGNYLVSFRHLDCIMLIAGDDGRVLWRLGGKHSDYILEDDLHFSRQHHARYISHSPRRDVISFLDNAAGEPEKDFQPPTNAYSRGFVVELLRPEDEPMRARVLKEYKRPDGGLADKRGSMQQLPNGNVLLAWTDAGYFSEHTEDDRVLMEGRFLNETRLGTYRMYKSTEWVGRPTRPPDVKALGYGIGFSSMTAIYVSWNGATEHRTWKFFSDGELLGSANRTGFETVFVTTNGTGMVRAEAYDINGEFLGSSNDVPTEYANGWVPVPKDPSIMEIGQHLEDPESMKPVEKNPPVADQAQPVEPPTPLEQVIPQDVAPQVITNPLPEPVIPIDLPTDLYNNPGNEQVSIPPDFTKPFYIITLVIPSVIGWYFILRVLYRSLGGMLISHRSYSKGYLEIPD